MLCGELITHLALMQREHLLHAWNAEMIHPGDLWRPALDEAIDAADVVLLLVSAHYQASDECFERQMERALQRQKRGEARVIPILLRPCDWKSAPFAALKSLPTNQLPVTSWPNRDEAFVDIALGIRQVLDESNRSHFVPDNVSDKNARVEGTLRGRTQVPEGTTSIQAPEPASATQRTPRLHVEFVRIPRRHPDDKQDRATATRLVDAFYIAPTCVTWKLYSDVVSGAKSRGLAEDLPVTKVSWIEAISFCNLLSDLESLQRAYHIEGRSVTWRHRSNGYRLPTEAEWEYAAYDEPRSIPENLGDFAWFAENTRVVQPVARKRPNHWGLYDVWGNVWEWCWDELDMTSERILRGGAYDSVPGAIQANFRFSTDPASRRANVGFRCVRGAMGGRAR